MKQTSQKGCIRFNDDKIELSECLDLRPFICQCDEAGEQPGKEFFLFEMHGHSNLFPFFLRMFAQYLTVSEVYAAALFKSCDNVLFDYDFFSKFTFTVVSKHITLNIKVFCNFILC